MTTYDRAYWESLWEKTLREHPDKVAKKPPNPLLSEVVSKLTPGRALDAGCGHGAESLWLAGHGWQVTGVDFSASALAHARSNAAAVGLSERVKFVEGDLSTWAPAPDSFELVTCFYVHAALGVEELMKRLMPGVTRGGHLLMVGHQAAHGQVQMSLGDARKALDSANWEIVTAEERSRAVHGPGVDCLVFARRR